MYHSQYRDLLQCCKEYVAASESDGASAETSTADSGPSVATPAQTAKDLAHVLAKNQL